MGKLIVFLLLAVAVYFVLRSGLRARIRRNRRGAAIDSEDMVACEHCGMNIPRSEAVDLRGRHFCSEEHRSLNAK